MEFSFDIKQHLKVLSTNKQGWTKELNIVAWGENDPKLDIREWNQTYERMSKGITLSIPEAIDLRDALNDYLRRQHYE